MELNAFCVKINVLTYKNCIKGNILGFWDNCRSFSLSFLSFSGGLGVLTILIPISVKLDLSIKIFWYYRSKLPFSSEILYHRCSKYRMIIRKLTEDHLLFFIYFLSYNNPNFSFLIYIQILSRKKAGKYDIRYKIRYWKKFKSISNTICFILNK